MRATYRQLDYPNVVVSGIATVCINMSSRGIFLLLTSLVFVQASLNTPYFPIKFGNCNFPSISEQLIKDEFFNKKWYVWMSSGNYFFAMQSKCAGTDTRIVGNDTEFLHFQYENPLNSFVTLKGNAPGNYLRYKGLVFPVDYSTNRYNFTLALSIVETDYDNWAAIYFCKQLLGSKIELSWLLTTDWKKTPSEEQKNEMSEAVSRFDYTLDDYFLQDNSRCGIGEPHL
ncbi:unnamed protein product [Nezara viridula]|uniref:Lipocalin/cytosolic fatty-acid binding domain-containing protein n=1 Tax=Nezara viridula TaxID=85310 RepID=A0A9P0HMF3_NEZVI|nr:unnamed protein product [Nezara viridula]